MTLPVVRPTERASKKTPPSRTTNQTKTFFLLRKEEVIPHVAGFSQAEVEGGSVNMVVSGMLITAVCPYASLVSMSNGCLAFIHLPSM